MKLSEQLEQAHNSGDFGQALEGFSEQAQKIEEALISFKKQYPNSPWIIKQVNQALGREFPIISDLPEHEQKPFSAWLAFKTVPMNKDSSIGYYQHDYDNWKQQHDYDDWELGG